jgi:hypothetical protein
VRAGVPDTTDVADVELDGLVTTSRIRLATPRTIPNRRTYTSSNPERWLDIPMDAGGCITGLVAYRWWDF